MLKTYAEGIGNCSLRCPALYTVGVEGRGGVQRRKQEGAAFQSSDSSHRLTAPLLAWLSGLYQKSAAETTNKVFLLTKNFSSATKIKECKTINYLQFHTIFLAVSNSGASYRQTRTQLSPGTLHQYRALASRGPRFPYHQLQEARLAGSPPTGK